MRITFDQGAGTDRGVDERFIELICADDELVQAEFDEIVAAEWRILPPVRRAFRSTDDDGHADDRAHPVAGPARPCTRGRVRAASSELVFARSPPRA
jgi:hypothetical protein